MEDRKAAGYVKLWRKTLESQVFLKKPAEWFKLWFYLVASAEWLDGEMPRGSLKTSYGILADDCGVTVDTVKNFIGWAKMAKMLSTQKKKLGTPTKNRTNSRLKAPTKARYETVIYILNYEKYQDKQELKLEQKPLQKIDQVHSQKPALFLYKKSIKKEYIATGVAHPGDKLEKKKRKDVELVEAFFEAKGWEMNSQVFRRYLRASKELLLACNDDIGLAKEKLTKVKRWADLKQLDWSLETVIKRWFELDNDTPRPKQAYIDGCKAYQNPRGDWMVINHDGTHLKWVGPLDKIEYA